MSDFWTGILFSIACVYLFVKLFGGIGLIIYIILVCIILYFVDKRKRKEQEELHKIEQARRERILLQKKEEIDAQYNDYLLKFVELVNNKYCRMHFENANYSSLDYKEQLTTYGLNRDVKWFVKLLLTIAKKDMVSKCINKTDFCHPTAISCSVAKKVYATAFYQENESKYNYTEGGKNPPDWEQRRMIVWRRDFKECQCCGVLLELSECHIHHIKRRSEGGSHELVNLVTLCKDCHTKMPGHEKMKAYTTYCITKNKIHVPWCKYARHLKPKIAAYSTLQNKGLKPCWICRPWERNEHKISNYKYSYDKEITEIMNLCLLEESKDKEEIQ